MENKTKHTPGPWAYYAGTYHDPGRGVIDPATDEVICKMGPGTADEQIARAHLMAAAPELLAAAEELYASFAPWLNQLEPFDTVLFQTLRAAIAKAGGAK